MYALASTMRPSQELRCICTRHFILGKGENAKLRGTKLAENREINKTSNMEISQYLRRTRERVPPGRASIIDNRTNITTIKLLNLIALKNLGSTVAQW